MTSLTRRVALKLMGIGSACLPWSRTQSAQSKPTATFTSQWSNTPDRVWLGPEFWANPMEDWRIADGAVECRTTGGNRNIQLLTHQLQNTRGQFRMSVAVSQLEMKRQDGGVGFRIGVRSDLNEYRSNCFARNGIRAGVVDGQIVLANSRKQLPSPLQKNATLVLSGMPQGARYQLTLTVQQPDATEPLAQISSTVAASEIVGNVAIVNNFAAKPKPGVGSRYAFRDWSVEGDAFQVNEQQQFGPILWSMYSLSDSRSEEGFVLKLSALTGPLGADDHKQLQLEFQRDGKWTDARTAPLDEDAWTATFRIPKWDATQDARYRLTFHQAHRDGSQTKSTWEGTIRANPHDRPLRLGALTCQNDYGFPYEPVANNLLKLDPDMLYFSGDQLYEGHGGYGIIREPANLAILNYLRKFYQFGWAFGEAMRDRPTLCIPDDHDVFQGNIWGEGGAAMKDLSSGASSKGGYREPARMVNVVHRTCAAHHPDYFDPTPCKQDISVYYGDIVYGGVGFAILGDRQWKSGPERVDTGKGRADHVSDPAFDCQKLDKPGLVLLGERQEKFLEEWSDDWRGHTLKVLLSQTVFAGVATHHGGYDGYLKGDLDCGGWPQTARNRAIGIIRESMALHINGDQHLTSLCQYGNAEQRDSNWSFCTPAIAAGYPRWWRPDEVGMPHQKRPAHGNDHTGEYRDGFGNQVYVYAIGNPEVASKKNRYEKAHQKGSGFGLVTIDPQQKTYKIEAFRFLIDATDGDPENQFPGWPVTLHQTENRGENRIS